ncbi:MAG: hypothetical protein JW390_10006 [Nitrosopumilus sp.]|nr:hypothetical protein [Candidatus Nitrosopumilus limneticus]
MKSMISIIRILQEYGITEQNISKINYEAMIRAKIQTDGDYMYDVLSDLKVDGLTQTTELNEIYLMIQSFMELARDNSPSQLIYQLIRTKTGIYKKISNDDSMENFIERQFLNDCNRYCN